MKRFFAWFMLLLFFFSIPASAGAVISSESNYGLQKVIVIFNRQIDEQTILQAGGKIKRKYDHIPACAITVPATAIQGLQKNPRVKAVESDNIISIGTQNPDWGIAATQAPLAWNSGLTGLGVKVAVVDSGIASHSDLSIAGGVSFTSYTQSYSDDNGHGTHVAGIIGARDNLYGTVGIAPQVSLYAVKVLDSNGSGFLSDVIAGIDWAITNHMDIVNLSMGTTTDSLSLKQIVDAAYNSGVLIVAAAGNSGTVAGDTDTVNYPAKYDSVIAVAAIDSAYNRAIFSSTGSKVEIAAPGVNVLSTYLYDDYTILDGTSMAAPYVSGDMALLKQKYPDLSNIELRTILNENVIDLGMAGRDNWYGYGLLQAPVDYTYTVTYNGNGDTGGATPVDGNTYLAGATVTVLGNIGVLAKNGYTLAGWNTKADGSGIDYSAGSTFAIGTANVTLYAKWISDIQPIEDFVTRFYQLCLLRDPDTGGLNYWVDLLITGQQTGAGISQGFILSNEFITRNVSDSDFLDIMYMTFFNRAADSGGKAYWQSQLDNGMSRLFILANFVNSNEFSSVCNSYGITRGSIQLTEPADLNPQVTAFVNRFYQLCLDRDPDSGGLNYWVNLLVTKQSTGANLSQGFVFSSEFTAKGLSNTGFITVMYRVFFDREPDGGGQAYWVGVLDAGTSRLQVLAGFVGSQEFAVLCSGIGIEVGSVNY